MGPFLNVRESFPKFSNLHIWPWESSLSQFKVSNLEPRKRLSWASLLILLAWISSIFNQISIALFKLQKSMTISFVSKNFLMRFPKSFIKNQFPAAFFFFETFFHQITKFLTQIFVIFFSLEMCCFKNIIYDISHRQRLNLLAYSH